MDDWDDEGDDFALTQDQLTGLDQLEKQALQSTSNNGGITTNPAFRVPQAVPGSKNARTCSTNTSYQPHGHQGSSHSNQNSSFHSKYSTKKPHPVQTNVHLDLLTLSQQTHHVHTSSSSYTASGQNDKKIPGFGEMTQLREQLNTYKTELNSMKEEGYSKDGQIKILRENLQKVEKELSQFKQDQLMKINQNTQQRNETEKQLTEKVEKLTSELQFKQREILEIQDNYKNFMQKTKSESPRLSQTSKESDRRNCQRKSASVSPKSPFPSMKTFSEKAARFTKPSPEEIPVVSRSRSTILQVRHPRGRMLGSELIGKMLNTSDKGQSAGGLLSIVTRPTRCVDVKEQSEDTDQRLKPETKSQGSSSRAVSRKSSTKGSEMAEANSTTTAVDNLLDHYELAMHGINTLLAASFRHTLTCASAAPSSEQNDTIDNAVLLLPIMEHTLHEFLEYVQLNPSNEVTVMTDAANASLERLCDREKMKAARTALCCLKEIVAHSTLVRQILVAGNQDEDLTNLLHESLSELGGSVFTKTLQTWGKENKILKKLFSLLIPVQEQEEVVNKDIILSSLQILTMVSQNCQDFYLKSFKGLLSGEYLLKCFLLDSSTILLDMLELLRIISRSNQLLTLYCSQSENCLLLCVYIAISQMCCYKTCNVSLSMRSTLSVKFVELLSAIVSSHPGGGTLLIESDCQCSLEVVKVLILVLYNEYQNYSDTKLCASMNSCLASLRKGISLLHALSLFDLNFVEHRHEVDHQFVSLVTGLMRIYKKEVISDSEVSLLHDLWEFEGDEACDETAMEVE